VDNFFSQKLLFPTLFLFSLVVFLFHTTYTKTTIFADARFYYMTTRSIIKDFDIKFANEYEHFNMQPVYTNAEYVWNKYPPGVSFFWIPALFVADGFSNALNPFDTSGFGIVYQIAVATSSVLLGLLGLYFLYQLLKGYFSEKVSLLTSLALFGTTNLFFYIALEPINSHAASFFVSSIFLYYFFKHKKDKYYYLILGLLGGVAGLVRTQDALILIIPILEIFLKSKQSFKFLATSYLLLSTGFLIGFFPQIYFWGKIFGTFWSSPYLEEGFNLGNPQIFHVLFNGQNGLFTLTPIILLSFLGLFLIKKKLKIISVYAIFYFLLQTYIISSWSAFYQGGSYSIRMMITTYPLLSFGLASIIEKSSKIIKERYVILITFFFTLLNMFFIIDYLLKY